MPVSPLLKAPFYSSQFYHIVCKSIDDVLLFRQEKDFAVLHQKFQQFTESYLDVWSHSLLINHTHYVVRVKEIENILDALKQQKTEKLTQSQRRLLENPTHEKKLDEMLERQMNRFLVSYANYYKNKYDHHGGLFQKPFKRISIDDDSHLQQAIIYTHANPQKHGMVDDYRQYPYSSYHSICNRYEENSYREVLNFFGGLTLFKKIHYEQIGRSVSHSRVGDSPQGG